MSLKVIKITVEGPVGSGKSAVLQVIQEELLNRGLEIRDVEGFDPQLDERTAGDLDAAVRGMIETDVEIVLVEKCEPRR